LEKSKRESWFSCIFVKERSNIQGRQTSLIQDDKMLLLHLLVSITETKQRKLEGTLIDLCSWSDKETVRK
jgi:hypothetical protein